MNRQDMKNPNQDQDNQRQNLSGDQTGGAFRNDTNREGQSQGQAYERAGGNTGNADAQGRDREFETSQQGKANRDRNDSDDATQE